MKSDVNYRWENNSPEIIQLSVQHALTKKEIEKLYECTDTRHFGREFIAFSISENRVSN